MRCCSGLQAALGLTFLLIALSQASFASAQTLDFASVTCASTTVVTGAHLTIITAGIRASFTITSRDSTSAARSVGGDAFVLSLSEDFGRPLAPFLDAWNGLFTHLISHAYLSALLTRVQGCIRPALWSLSRDPTACTSN